MASWISRKSFSYTPQLKTNVGPGKNEVPSNEHASVDVPWAPSKTTTSVEKKKKMQRLIFLVLLLSPLTMLAQGLPKVWKVNDDGRCRQGINPDSGQPYGRPTCAEPALQACANAASGGEVLFLPPCTAIWSKQTLGLNKALSVIGSGRDATVITVDETSVTSAISVTGCSGGDGVVRISSLSLVLLDRTGYSAPDNYVNLGADGLIALSGVGCTWLIDWNNFTGVPKMAKRTMRVKNYPVHGVMAHNNISDMGFMADGIYTGENQNARLHPPAAGTYSWAEPSSAGTSLHFYIEDNTWTYHNRISNPDKDCEDGCRVTWRHNQLLNPAGNYDIGPFDHGLDSVARSGRELVAHDNYVEGGGDAYVGFLLRGGSGLFYKNRFRGKFNGPMLGLTNYRSNVGNYYPYCQPNDGAGHCLRQNNKTGIADVAVHALAACDGNNAPHTCEPCDGKSLLDHNEIPYGAPGSGGGYPCGDQIGRGQNQKPQPVLFWANSVCPADATGDCGWNSGGTHVAPTAFAAGASSPNGDNTLTHIVLGRDYFDIPFGPESARPVKCSAGTPDYYAATDINTVSKCGPMDNTWTVIYSEFSYPHPLLAANTFSLSVTSTDVITSSPAGISCKNCLSLFSSGTVALSAPEGGNWTGCDEVSSDGTICTVLMLSNKSVSFVGTPAQKHTQGM